MSRATRPYSANIRASSGEREDEPLEILVGRATATAQPFQSSDGHPMRDQLPKQLMERR
jgi:hypothetical protein